MVGLDGLEGLFQPDWFYDFDSNFCCSTLPQLVPNYLCTSWLAFWFALLESKHRTEETDTQQMLWCYFALSPVMQRAAIQQLPNAYRFQSHTHTHSKSHSRAKALMASWSCCHWLKNKIIYWEECSKQHLQRTPLHFSYISPSYPLSIGACKEKAAVWKWIFNSFPSPTASKSQHRLL